MGLKENYASSRIFCLTFYNALYSPQKQKVFSDTLLMQR